jgi:hypothetical protein
VFSFELQENTPSAEVVWTETENKQHTLYYRFFNNGSWSESAAAIYSSENPITTPTLTTRATGKKLVFWAEQLAGSIVIKMMQGQIDSQLEPTIRWGMPTLFSDLGQFSIAPSAVVDWNDDVWVFWAADVAKYSDIYYSRTSELGWSEPVLIHQANSVPDNTPLATINEQGMIDVVWQTFDLEASQYRFANEQYLVESRPRKSDLAKLLAEEQDFLDGVIRPDFLPSQQRLFVHFPRNRLIQSIEAHKLIVAPTAK